jgi:hypothetical protein
MLRLGRMTGMGEGDSSSEDRDGERAGGGDGALSEDATPVCLGCMTPVTAETRYCPNCLPARSRRRCTTKFATVCSNLAYSPSSLSMSSCACSPGAK